MRESCASLTRMKQAGNKQDVETDYVPRIGERIVLEYGRGGGPVRSHYL
jgi:hypothetical protein